MPSFIYFPETLNVAEVESGVEGWLLCPNCFEQDLWDAWERKCWRCGWKSKRSWRDRAAMWLRRCLGE